MFKTSLCAITVVFSAYLVDLAGITDTRYFAFFFMLMGVVLPMLAGFAFLWGAPVYRQCPVLGLYGTMAAMFGLLGHQTALTMLNGVSGKLSSGPLSYVAIYSLGIALMASATALVLWVLFLALTKSGSVAVDTSESYTFSS
jgi:hypothetical protein